MSILSFNFLRKSWWKFKSSNFRLKERRLESSVGIFAVVVVSPNSAATQIQQKRKNNSFIHLFLRKFFWLTPCSLFIILLFSIKKGHYIRLSKSLQKMGLGSQPSASACASSTIFSWRKEKFQLIMEGFPHKLNKMLPSLAIHHWLSFIKRP